MDASLKYRTQGSLPIGRQSYSQYIPRGPEQKPPPSPSKAKQKVETPRGPSPENRQSPPLILQEPPPARRQAAPAPAAPAPAAPAPAAAQYKPSPFDPCQAIIGSSPYYIYHQMMCKNGARHAVEEDLRGALTRLVVVDKDLTRTAKYRNFCSEMQ